jgi:hypothetical protein
MATTHRIERPPLDLYVNVVTEALATSRSIETSGAAVQHAALMREGKVLTLISRAGIRRAHRTAKDGSLRSRAILTLLSLLAAPARADAQEPPPLDVESRGAANSPASTIETVEVLGNRETVHQAAQVFVANLTRSDGDELARWRLPICPVVYGMSLELDQFVRQRLLATAASVGAPHDLKTGCRPNLLVVLTDQPEDMLTTLRKRKMMLIGTGLPKNTDGVEFEIPVRIWRSAVLNNADGTGPRVSAEEVPQFRAENSRIISGVAESIGAVVVMVDTTQTGAATFNQLADFVAMVSLARIDLNENLANATTILRLFAPSVAALPAGLTDWDRAFLKGLYESRDALVHQRSQIARSMARDLVP